MTVGVSCEEKNPSYDCCQTTTTKPKQFFQVKKKTQRTFFSSLVVVKRKNEKISFQHTHRRPSRENPRSEKKKAQKNLIQTMTSRKTKIWARAKKLIQLKLRALGGLRWGISRSVKSSPIMTKRLWQDQASVCVKIATMALKSGLVEYECNMVGLRERSDENQQQHQQY